MLLLERAWRRCIPTRLFSSVFNCLLTGCEGLVRADLSACLSHAALAWRGCPLAMMSSGHRPIRWPGQKNPRKVGIRVCVCARACTRACGLILVRGAREGFLLWGKKRVNASTRACQLALVASSQFQARAHIHTHTCTHAEAFTHWLPTKYHLYTGTQQTNLCPLP